MNEHFGEKSVYLLFVIIMSVWYESTRIFFIDFYGDSSSLIPITSVQN